jgi:hypothetical protein
MSDIRAPRLTEARLDDLAQCVATLDGEIEYLREAIKANGLNPRTLDRFKDKLGKLQRGRDWINGKVAAERAQRNESPARCAQQGCQRAAGDACDFAGCPSRADTGDVLAGAGSA